MNFVSNSNDVSIGDAATATVDLADAKNLAQTGLSTSHSIIAHEINEQYQVIKAKVNGTFKSDTLARAHFGSIYREKIINGINYYLETLDDGSPKEPYMHKNTECGFLIILDCGSELEFNLIDLQKGTITNRFMHKK